MITHAGQTRRAALKLKVTRAGLSVILILLSAMSINLILSSSSVFAQGATAREAAKNRKSHLDRKAAAKARYKQRVKAEPFWQYPINGAMETVYGIDANPEALNSTMQEVVTIKRAASIRSDNTGCVTCHGNIAQQGRLNLEGMSRQNFCQLVPGFLSNRSTGNGRKPPELKAFFKQWYDSGCRNSRGNSNG